jgi:hypothetical protein
MRIRGGLWLAVLAAGCSSSLASPQGNSGGAGGGGDLGEGGVPATGGAPTGGAIDGGVGGTGGLGGVGGIAGGGGSKGGSGGAANMGGAGGLPLCAQTRGSADGGLGGAAVPDVESCVYDADNNPVLTTVSAAVTVASIEQVPDGNCSFFRFPFPTTSSTPSSKIVLESADQQFWTVYLRVPNMPASTIQVGDSFDLEISGYYFAQASFTPPQQMIALAKNGRVVAFGSTTDQTTALGPLGVTIRDGGAVCQDPPFFNQCYGFAHRAVSVAYGANGAVVQEGETAQIGDLTFTLSHDLAWQQSPSQCDGSSYAIMGGFVAPP